MNIAHHESDCRLRTTGLRVEPIAFETEYAEVPELGGKIRFRALLSLELNEIPPVIEL